MPRKVYIICCETALTDSVTGLMSYMNVFDTLRLVPSENATPATAVGLRMRLSSVWMLKHDETLGQEYEHEFAIRTPGPPAEEFPSQRTTFKFDKTTYRFDANFELSPMPQPSGRRLVLSGLCFIESRIRRVGELCWDIQDYPLLVDSKSSSSPDALPPG